MIALAGGLLQATTPAPFTGVRDYECYLRGPVGAITHRFGSAERYRHGGWHSEGLLADWPAPSDAFIDGNGILESGQCNVAIQAPQTEPARADFYALTESWRTKTVELELVTRHHRLDGSAVEITHERRMVVARTARRRDQLSLALVDVDRSALERLFPAETYTVADWPELFADHVNRPVPQVVGTVQKVPLTYLVKSGGAWKYAVAKVLGSAATVLTVYRDGRVVAPTEYLVATLAAAVSPYSVTVVSFTKEQSDPQGRLYTLEADVTGPGSRTPADEISRMLATYSVTVDAGSFASSAAYHLAQGIRGDYGYVTHRTGNAILQDLLAVARAQLAQRPDGSYALVQDQPRDAAAMFDAATDLIAVEEYERPELRKTVTLQYRPTTSQREDFAGKLQRTTSGVAGELLAKSPFIRDHDVADRHLCYLTKRETNRGAARATVHGVQFAAGDVVAIASEIHWAGGKLWSTPQVTRGADQNQVRLEEYNADTYVYSAGTLPSGATNDYLPDYSQTPPAAPTGLAVISQGTSVDNDGKVTAYALVRAVPPAVNWARLVAQVRDTTTNEIYQAQLLLSGGNYEATVSGLRPNRAHQVIAWAVNATNVDGLTAAAVAFTSANYTTTPAAPTGMQIAQGTGKVIRVACQASAIANFREYVWFRKEGSGGTYVEIRRGDNNWLVDEAVQYGFTYYYRARAVDRSGNESTDSSEVSLLLARTISDPDIPNGGINGPTIGDGSINRLRSYTGTGSASLSIGAGSSQTLELDAYTFFPSFAYLNASEFAVLTSCAAKNGAADRGRIRLQNNNANTVSVDVDWRNFLS